MSECCNKIGCPALGDAAYELVIPRVGGDDIFANIRLGLPLCEPHARAFEFAEFLGRAKPKLLALANQCGARPDFDRAYINILNPRRLH